MIVANLVLAAGLLPLLLVDGAGPIWIVYPVLVLEAVVETFFAPAEQAMLPRVVDDSDSADLVTANALNGQARNVARLVGGALGGVLAALGGIPLVALADAAPSSWRPCSRPDPYVGRGRAPARGDRRGRRPRSLRRAPRGLGGGRSRGPGLPGDPGARGVLPDHAFGEGIWGTLFAPYVRSVLDGGRRGARADQRHPGRRRGDRRALRGAYGSRWRPVRMLGFGALVFGAGRPGDRALPAGLGAAWPAAALMVVVGLPGAVMSAGMMTLFQQHTDDRERGRVFALLLLVRSTFQVLGSLTAGLLGGVLGIVPVMAWQGCGYVLAGALVVLLLVRREDSSDATSPRPVGGGASVSA